MATTPRFSVKRKVDYPTSDGKPMAETDVHRQDMVDLIETLQDRYQDDPNTYVTGNLLLFYEEGNRRKHISPDVFLVRGVPKIPPRDNYLLWEEGKGPDVVIELTSRTTRKEDREKKFEIYRDLLKVREYFLFDPSANWLIPPLQGYRLAGADYTPIKMVRAHFLPSEILGLWLVRDRFELRLYDPSSGDKLLTRQERLEESEAERRQEEKARRKSELTLELMEAREQLSRAEIERLRLENEELRKRLSGTQ